MKKSLLIILFFCAVSAASAQVLATTNDPVKVEASHDFGAIPQGKPVTYAFVVTNTGTEPLILENVSASCGCTTPQWSKEPVPVGGKTNVTVGYNAASEGGFEKSVTLQYNGGRSKTIYIKGKVDKPQPPAPYNASVQLLKQSNQ